MAKANTSARLELDGEVLELDMNTLTLGEIEEVEVYFDSPIDQVPWDSGRGGLILAYLAKRRRDPDTTLDDLRDVKVSALKEAKLERPTKKTPARGGTRS